MESNPSPHVGLIEALEETMYEVHEDGYEVRYPDVYSIDRYEPYSFLVKVKRPYVKLDFVEKVEERMPAHMEVDEIEMMEYMSVGGEKDEGIAFGVHMKTRGEQP